MTAMSICSWLGISLQSGVGRAWQSRNGAPLCGRRTARDRQAYLRYFTFSMTGGFQLPSRIASLPQ
jgi:hypothetical protein